MTFGFSSILTFDGFNAVAVDGACLNENLDGSDRFSLLEVEDGGGTLNENEVDLVCFTSAGGTLNENDGCEPKSVDSVFLANAAGDLALATYGRNMASICFVSAGDKVDNWAQRCCIPLIMIFISFS